MVTFDQKPSLIHYGWASSPLYLGFSFGNVINSWGSELKESLLPRLFSVFFEVQNAFQVRHDDWRSTEVLLHNQKHSEVIWDDETSSSYQHLGNFIYLPAPTIPCLCLSCLWEFSYPFSKDKSSESHKESWFKNYTFFVFQTKTATGCGGSDISNMQSLYIFLFLF